MTDIVHPPTLSEMRSHLLHASQESESIEVTPPTASEMRAVVDTKTLEHFGIKGMKWGIRRSDKELAKIRGESGEVEGSIKGASRQVVAKIRSMKTNDVAVLDTEDGPIVVAKMGDGSLKKTRLSADAESFLRTMNKTPSEMSTREMKEAVSRAQQIEAYNKIFNPMADPNAAMRTKAENMKLQLEYSKAYAQLHPPKPSALKRLSGLVQSVSPAFQTVLSVDKALGGHVRKKFDQQLQYAMFGNPNLKPRDSSSSSTSSSSTKKKSSRSWRRRGSSSSSDSTVYNITTVGQDDYLNPFVPELESRK